MANLEGARLAQALLEELLAADDNVSGVGITGSEGNYRLVINLFRSTGLAYENLQVFGAPVEVNVIGTINAFDEKEES